MADPARQLAEIIKIIVDTSTLLSTRGSELLTKLIDLLPPDEEPTPLTLDVSEDTTDETGMTVLLAWDNSGTDEHVTIDWGAPDAVDDDEPPTGSASYRYLTTGTYTITVTDLVDATRVATADVTVPYPGHELTLTVAENTVDTTRMSIDVTVDNSGSGTVTVNLGDGSPVVANPGDGTTVTTYLYPAAGTFTVTATDDDDATRTATTTVTVPFTSAGRRRR